MKKIIVLLLIASMAINVLSQNKIVNAYYPDWSTYGRDYQVAELPFNKLNHITFAFVFPFIEDGTLVIGDEVVYRGTSKKAVIVSSVSFTDDNGKRRTTGLCLIDWFADIEKTSFNPKLGAPSWLSGMGYAEQLQNWAAMEDNKKPGVLGQLIIMKKEYPHMKTLVSVGGWTLSQPFPIIADDINAREAFAIACQEFVTKFQFDGIDFDWEFPVQGGTDGNETIDHHSVPKQTHNTRDPENFVMLCKAVKEKLPSNVKLTIAINQNHNTVSNMYIFEGNKSNWSNSIYKGYDKSTITDHVDYLATMTYDYGGAWLSVTSNQAPLYPSNHQDDPDKDLSVSSFIDKLLELQVDPSKIIMGVPFYGRGWNTVEGGDEGDGLYQKSHQTLNIKGSWDAANPGEFSASFDYGDLKDGKATNKHQYIKDGVGTGNEGFIEYWNETCKVPYLYNASTGVFITYDNPKSIEYKVKYAMSKNLAGVFTWEITQDDNSYSMISSMYDNAQVFDVIISGSIVDASGNGIQNVTIKINDGNSNTDLISDNNGQFSKTVTGLKNYDITIEKSGFIFTPQQLDYEMISDNKSINIIGSSGSASISGAAKNGSGTNITDCKFTLKTGSKIISTIESSDGTYNFSNIPTGFKYIISVENSFYTFNQTELTVNNLTSAQVDKNFTGTIKTYSISGSVTDKSGNVLEGKTIILNGSSTTTTNESGNYSFTNLEAAADYSIEIEDSDIFISPRKKVINSLSKDETLNFSEPSNIVISGYFKNGSTPLANKNVVITKNWVQGWQYSHTATTDSKGFFFLIAPEAVTSLSNVVVKPESGSYFPKEGYTFSSLTKSVSCSFNTNQETVDIDLYSIPNTINLEDNTSYKISTIITKDDALTLTKVSFIVDGQNLTAVNSSGNTFEADWTPSEHYKEYEIKTVVVTSTGNTYSKSKEVFIDCNSGTCPNKRPVIDLTSPQSLSITQENLTSFNISAKITDEGTISDVKFYIDNNEISKSNSGDTYSTNFNPTQYKSYNLKIEATDNNSETTTFQTQFTIREPSNFTSAPDFVIVGYWHNWENAQAPFIKLKDVVNTKYNVVCVSFIETQNQDGYNPVFTPDRANYPTDKDFIDDVNILKNAGIPVIISIGGQNGHVELKTEEQKNIYVNGVIDIVEKYGFDGIDIDYEGGSMTAFKPSATSLELSDITNHELRYGIEAIRDIYNHFGDGFLITAAPEIAYVQDGRLNYPNGGQFIPFLHNLRDILAYVHVQLYNFGTNSWSAMDGKPYPQGSPDVVVSLTEMLCKGFKLGNTNLTFPGLREDQVAIGLMASEHAGGPGYYMKPETVKKGLDYLIKGEKSSSLSYILMGKDKYPDIRGMMTWSINWDATTDGGTEVYEYADNYYTYFSEISNKKPDIELTSPQNLSQYNVSSNITISANASDTDGSIKNVKFFVNGNEIANKLVAPYEYTWIPAEAGSFNIYAIAYDDKDKPSKSKTVYIKTTIPGAPLVALTSPANNTSLEPENNLTMKANASDEDGTITKIEFYIDNNLKSSDDLSPYEFSYNNLSFGKHEVFVKAYDNDNKTTKSQIHTIYKKSKFDINCSISGSNESIDGVTVKLYKESELISSGTTNNQGNYTFNNVVSNENYKVIVSKEGELYTPSEITLENLSKNENPGFSVVEGIYVEGYIMDGNTPIPDATVQVVVSYVSELLPWANFMAKTNSEGYYKTKVIPNGYKLTTINVQPWTVANKTLYPEKYDYSALDAVKRCDFNSQNGFSVSGNVSYSSVGLNDVKIELKQKSNNLLVKSTITDINGEFSINGISEGEYTITATKENFNFGDSKNISLTDNITNISIDGTFTGNYFTVSGNINKPDGGDFENVQVVISGGISNITATDANGNFSFSNLPEGSDYEIKFNSLGHSFTPPKISIPAIDSDKSYSIESSLKTTPDKMIGAYIGGWASIWNNSDIVSTLSKKTTHIFYAFALIGSGNTLKVKTTQDISNFSKLEQVRAENPNIKILISIGGATSDQTEGFRRITQNNTNLDEFVNDVTQYMKDNNFDGIDIDWEFPVKGEEDEYKSLISALRKKLNELSSADNKNYLLTTAISFAKERQSFIDYATLHESLDYINLMTYDIFGAWNMWTAHNSPLYKVEGLTDKHWAVRDGYNYSLDECVKYMMNEKSVPKEKLIIGGAFYGRGYSNVNAGSNYGLFEEDSGIPESKYVTPSYKELSNSYINKNGFTRYWDDISKVPYLYNPTSKIWISYDDEQSIAEKANYALDNNLGGMMIWALYQDDDSNGYPLMTTVFNTMNGVIQTDTEAPQIVSFTSPSSATSSSVNINIETYDNIGVTGYLIKTNDPNTPSTSDSQWKSSKPKKINLTKNGELTIYLWVKDNAGNISQHASQQITVKVSDSQAPIITEFSTSNSTIVTEKIDIKITATDNISVSGYFIKFDDSSTPSVNDSGWEYIKPLVTVVPEFGERTVYLWVKDVSGNISTPSNFSVNYIENDTESPVINSFTTTEDTVFRPEIIVEIDASDNVGISHYLIKQNDSSTPESNSSDWKSFKPKYLTLPVGVTTLYLWVKDIEGNISVISSLTVTYLDNDNSKPVIFDFTTNTPISDILTIPINITATDNNKIDGYIFKINDNTAPTADDSEWVDIKPTTYTFENRGRFTLYLWVKDAAGNISELKSIIVSIKKFLSISGIIVDQNIQPVEGVDIVIGGDIQLNLKSDSNGKFYVSNIIEGSNITINISMENVSFNISSKIYNSIKDNISLSISATISTDIIDDKYKLSLYPNPVSKYLNINTAIEFEGILSNSEGKILKEIKVKRGVNTFDVGDMKSGQYYISINGYNSSKMFIIE